ncbi:hypothetical protein TWF481_005978 [Arthrobotrys musiformis]|uniref:Uncharacterized protein n=1 Tax=Arthrobotrys musiformis TaxID=47236 RepID=A0AAV9WH08_9PEZI
MDEEAKCTFPSRSNRSASKEMRGQEHGSDLKCAHLKDRAENEETLSNVGTLGSGYGNLDLLSPSSSSQSTRDTCKAPGKVHEDKAITPAAQQQTNRPEE